MNPVKTSTRDTHEEVATAIKGVKSGKAAGEDEIRPEMLKALTGEGILWLTRVCQVAWKFGKTSTDWLTSVIIPIFKKRDRQQCTNYRTRNSQRGGGGAFLEAANNIKQTWLKFLSLLIRLGRFFYEN